MDLTGKFGKVFDQIYIPAGLIILNFILKSAFLGSRDIAMDEPFTIFYAQADLCTIFETMKNGNNPPLFYYLLHFWIKIFGISAVSVRFLPMIFSVGTAWMLFLIGKKFFSLRVGLIASLIFTFSDCHQLFAHEARVYSLFALLTTVSFYLFFSLRNLKSLRTIILLVLTNVLLVYAHFFGFIVIFIQLFSCLVIKELRDRILKQYLIILFILLLLYIPYLFILINRFWMTSMHGTWVPKPVLSDLYNMIWRFSNAPVVTVFFILILITGGILFLFRAGKTALKTGLRTKIILIWFFLPYFAMFLISFYLPMFLDRYLVFISVAYYLLIGIAIEYISRDNKWLFYSISLVTVGMMAFTFHPNIDNKRRIKETVQTIKMLKTKDTVVIICPEWLDLGFTYYYNPDHFREYKDLKNNLNNERIYPVNSVTELDTALVCMASNVVFFEEWSTLVDKNSLILKFLNGHFKSVESFHIFESFNVYNFQK